jgi:imidazole glycerol-phosphate synthase subunit HisH
MTADVVVVDMQISNLASVAHALARIGTAWKPATPASIGTASAILLPGVGSFGDGMASLREKGLVEPLRRASAAGTPIFGICLGMQLLAERSDEFGAHEGLALLRGQVKALPRRPGVRVPNIGWCDVKVARPSVLFPRGMAGCYYHVHSYQLIPDDKAAVTAAIDFGGDEVAVAIESGNLFGVQFHPEKSQDDGLEVLSSFFTELQRRGHRA